MKRRTIFLPILLFVVIGAASLFLPVMLRRLSGVTVRLPSQPTAPTQLEQASVSPSINETIALLGVTETGPGDALQARPVDPMTLSDLPGYKPINFGQNYTYAVSPDRQLLAVITWPKGILHLIDLQTWTDAVADVRIDDYVVDLTFDTEGKALYWMSPRERDPSHGMPRGYQLYRYDLDSRHLSAITPLPSNTMPWAQRLASGKVVIFGVPTDPDNLAIDAPHVVIIDPMENRIAADVRFDEVKAGQFQEQLSNGIGSATEEQYVTYGPGLAWDLERKVLYVVHAEDDQVTALDLVSGEITKQMQIRPRHPFIEWISKWLAPTAAAKGGPEKREQAVLSPNGELLYVLSQRTEEGILSSASLRAIATHGMREIRRLDQLLTDFSLTEDGRSLLVAKAESVAPYGFDMLVTQDLYVLDAQTLKERAHIQADQVDDLWFDGFSPDGRYAYLRGSSARWIEGTGWRDWQTKWLRLDLNTYELTLVREFEANYAVLLHLTP